jgi:hypothetical protein
MLINNNPGSLIKFFTGKTIPASYFFFLAIGILLISVLIYKIIGTKTTSNFANMASNDAINDAITGITTGITTLYYSPTCPHCVNIMPVWRQITAKHGAKVQSVNVAEHPGVFAEQGLTGVPAIKKGNRVYSGPRTFEDISKFISL